MKMLRHSLSETDIAASWRRSSARRGTLHNAGAQALACDASASGQRAAPHCAGADSWACSGRTQPGHPDGGRSRAAGADPH
ncbi:hypothetical protein XAC3810_10046 [Xanthomonas citri pv. citri]|uniref:Uncharacterized protein n=1 Tax=Xanthomonas citri pv. citri TaxID=611301 RepID=A0A0U5F7G6_XANCI|nr:hypothetical protein XAC3824_10044 [Xanthomonas citri pv. citri]CEE16140.1 hypothetical protein XAC9322_10046 [Xanthomonas citri pv. citri]CEE16176.1 hypothetical protein XAC1083_10046 [Xanthomonas citri pv. citri]CEE16910.1 hypothetical protein XAC902_10046 [Xanthomonas citri pv. citri]CEE21524.1 hypothetical protein XAC3810_10046 [Xanthomonas citri pv. citri]